MVKAVIYIPPDIKGDGRFGTEGTDYVVSHGYAYAGHMRNPDVVDYLLATGQATVVLLLSRAHQVPGRVWPIEFVHPQEQDTPPLTSDARRGNGKIWVSLLAIAHKPRKERREFADDPTVALIDVWRRRKAARVLRGDNRSALYETARLFPRGDDGGFAEAFLRDRDT